MNLGMEDETQEFKEGLGQLDKGLKSITAMLNKHGRGTVYFGVKDNGDVCGLDIGKKTLMDIRNIISSKIEPRIYPEIEEKADENGNRYIKITASGFNIPYSFDGRYYVRNVSADEAATNEVLRKMLTTTDADIIRQKTSYLQNLTFSSFSSVLIGCGIHIKGEKEFYSNYGLLTRGGKFNFNAYLLCDSNNVSIKIITFAGTDKTVMSMRTEYGNHCLLISVMEVLRFFESLNVTKVILGESKREEIPLFDFPSFREAWINACVHNDWNNEIPPSVYLFDDRIEIVSYGGLPFSLSREGFYKGTSVPVNKSLLMVFMAAKLSEQSGHGVPTIVEKYGKEAFTFEDDTIKVTIPLSFERAEVAARKVTEIHKKKLTEGQRKVYEALADNESATIKDVAGITSLSEGGVKKICSTLQEYGLLERIGTKRSGKWVVK